MLQYEQSMEWGKSMASVYQYVEPEGVITPDTEEIKNQVIGEYQNTFGADLIVTPDTPQGMLITTEVLSRDALVSNNAILANQINPNVAGGIFLDAIMALTGIQRAPESFSVVSANLTGVAGTIIPEGSQAKETVNGEVFASVSSVTLSVGGTATVNFQAVDPGAVAAGSATLTTIVSNILGWETVTNPTDATLGTDTQDDEAARGYRKQTLAFQGSSLAEAILSGLYATPNVISASFRENMTDSTATIDGVSMIANSIYVCVDGGTDSDIANTLFTKKSGGCAYNNGPGVPVDVTFTAPFSGQIMDILFDRPNPVPVIVRATVSALDSLTDPTDAVKNAIVNYANGNIPGEPGLTVGTDVSCFELASAVNYYDRSIFVSNMEISLASSPMYSNTTISIGIFEIATLDAGSINVVVT